MPQMVSEDCRRVLGRIRNTYRGGAELASLRDCLRQSGRLDSVGRRVHAKTFGVLLCLLAASEPEMGGWRWSALGETPESHNACVGIS